MTDLSIFRVYEPDELGEDGYPLVWHRGFIPVEDLFDGEWIADYETRISWALLDPDVHDSVTNSRCTTEVGVKHIVRMLAGHRCVRCGHPFTVGKSGVMEGPHAESKAKAAEMGMTQEQFDSALMDHVELITHEEVLARAARVNWSPCDERCTHGGPIRWRSAMTGNWHTRDDRVGVNHIEFMLKEVDAVEAAWRILTVHHLNGRKHDLRWWNLIPVCQRCHLYLQRIVVMERVYPFEHDDYFKPYAAGWYASTYLKEDLTREQTMGRLDELLALERMA